MSDQISFPPLHDPAPAEVERRKQHLLNEITGESRKARRSLRGVTFPRHRVRLAIALGLVAASAGAIVGGMSLTGQRGSAVKPRQNAAAAKASSSGVSMNPMAAPPTMEYPLGKGFGEQVSLADAASALGRPVALPDTAQVKPSDVGAVQMESSSGDGQRVVDLGISFPKQGLIVEYIQPPISDPLSNYQVAVSNSEGSLIYLNGGVPALTKHSPLPDGSPWGFVRFVAGGSTINVMGPSDEATLQAAAQSILDQINSG
jgi:hypothetical protein